METQMKNKEVAAGLLLKVDFEHGKSLETGRGLIVDGVEFWPGTKKDGSVSYTFVAWGHC